VQRVQAGHEEVLTTAGDHEARQATDTAPDGPFRDRERAGPVVSAAQRSFSWFWPMKIPLFTHSS